MTARTASDEDTAQPITHELRFESGQRLAAVPASVLADTLTAAQRVVHLLAMARNRRPPPRHRLRVPGEVERAYQILCTPPVVGSYVQPFRIGDPASDLLTPVEARDVSRQLDQVLEAAVRGDERAVSDVLPDAWYRRAVIDGIARMAPRPSSGLTLRLTAGGGQCFDLSEARPQLLALLALPESEAVDRALIGILDGIDFGERKLKLVLPATRRAIECFYLEEAEPMLLANPRELIQVVGQVQVDAEGEPLKVVETKAIREVDLEPLPLPPFLVDGRRVAPREPRLLTPQLDDETQQIFVLIDEGLGIDLAAETRVELEESFAALLPYLWRSYALADDNELAQDARRLKVRLRAAFTEVEVAAQEP